MNSLAREVTMNAAVCIPEPVWALQPFGSFYPIEWSYHALEGAAEDNFWHAPSIIKFDRERVVEVTVAPTTGMKVKVSKIVMRVPSPDKGDNERDMVLVLVPYKNRPGKWYVVSCYANHKEDQHFTLNIERIAPEREINRVAQLLSN